MKANSFQERVAVTEGRELIPRIITRANPNTPEIYKASVHVIEEWTNNAAIDLKC